MFDTTPDGIREMVASGESQYVEFKSRLMSDDIIAKVVSGFANTDGGIILVGIGDNGEVIGVPESELNSTLSRLKRIISSLLPYEAKVDYTVIDAKRVVYAVVKKTPKEFSPITTSRGQSFQRKEDRIIYVTSYKRARLRRKRVSVATEERVRLFIAMSFREEEEPALVDYFRAMERAVEAISLPIDIKKINLEEGDYEISQKIMDEIDQAQIVLADFTLSPRNVYFELGYARGKNKRIIQTGRQDTELEFDVRNWRTVLYRNATELEAKLQASIESAYGDIISAKS